MPTHAIPNISPPEDISSLVPTDEIYNLWKQLLRLLASSNSLVEALTQFEQLQVEINLQFAALDQDYYFGDRPAYFKKLHDRLISDKRNVFKDIPISAFQRFGGILQYLQEYEGAILTLDQMASKAEQLATMRNIEWIFYFKNLLPLVSFAPEMSYVGLSRRDQSLVDTFLKKAEISDPVVLEGEDRTRLLQDLETMRQILKNRVAFLPQNRALLSQKAAIIEFLVSYVQQLPDVHNAALNGMLREQEQEGALTEHRHFFRRFFGCTEKPTWSVRELRRIRTEYLINPAAERRMERLFSVPDEGDQPQARRSLQEVLEASLASVSQLGGVLEAMRLSLSEPSELSSSPASEDPFSEFDSALDMSFSDRESSGSTASDLDPLEDLRNAEDPIRFSYS